MAGLRSFASRAPPVDARAAGASAGDPRWPIVAAPGYTKADIVRYHERLAARLLPQVAPRPVAVARRGEGLFYDRLYARHPLPGRVGDDGPAPFIRVADIAGIVRAVQHGIYEFHTWGATFPRIERPDRITLGLDADAAAPWWLVREAAEQLRALLERLDLRGFVKTSGGDGLHFVLPITRRHTWAEVCAFARALAETLARTVPSLFSATPDARIGRVRIDPLNNAEGATAVAAYSLRARCGLPVSMPVAWADLDSDVRGRHFNIDNTASIVARRGVDPWADYDRSHQTLSASMRRALRA